MAAVMKYVKREDKVKWEDKHLVTGINCRPDTACEDFLRTKQLYRKEGGVLFYHMVQSFPKGADVDPKTARTAVKDRSWKFQLMAAIGECMEYAKTRGEGYDVKWTDTRKYITYTTLDGGRCCDNKLHEEKYLKALNRRDLTAASECKTCVTLTEKNWSAVVSLLERLCLMLDMILATLDAGTAPTVESDGGAVRAAGESDERAVRRKDERSAPELGGVSTKAGKLYEEYAARHDKRDALADQRADRISAEMADAPRDDVAPAVDRAGNHLRDRDAEEAVGEAPVYEESEALPVVTG